MEREQNKSPEGTRWNRAGRLCAALLVCLVRSKLLTQREDRQQVVKIRLQKLGRRNRAYFRIVVADARVKRQGAYLEKLGQYDPIETDLAKQLTVNTDRVK